MFYTSFDANRYYCVEFTNGRKTYCHILFLYTHYSYSARYIVPIDLSVRGYCFDSTTTIIGKIKFSATTPLLSSFHDSFIIIKLLKVQSIPTLEWKYGVFYKRINNVQCNITYVFVKHYSHLSTQEQRLRSIHKTLNVIFISIITRRSNINISEVI